MKLLLLGSGGYYPTPLRQTSCVYFPDHALVLDAGTGIWRLGERGLPPQLDVVLTHGHQDHSIGLIYLPGALRKSGVKTLRIWSAPGVAEEVTRRLFGEPLFARTLDDLPFETRVMDLPPRVDINGVTVQSDLMPHGLQGSLALRVVDDSGASAVLMTDTHATAAQAAFCRGADLLLADCYYRSDQKEKAAAAAHSTPTLMARLAKTAEVKRLVLLHINPAEPEPQNLVEEARAVFPDTELGEDNMEIEIAGSLPPPA